MENYLSSAKLAHSLNCIFEVWKLKSAFVLLDAVNEVLMSWLLY